MPARLYIVGRPTMDWPVMDQFLAAEAHEPWIRHNPAGVTPAALLVELAGRVCYMSFGKDQGRFNNKDYITNLIAANHTSVLEHAVWQIVIAGVSRSLTHELVRHRVGWSYSQLSQRYVNEYDVSMIMPAAIEALPDEQRRAWQADMRDARATYNHWSEVLTAAQPEGMTKRDARIAARQAARSVLPNATETKLFVTVNARALRHFFLLRGSLHAEPEIRALAHQWLTLMQGEAPHLFGDLAIKEGAIVHA